MQRACRRFCRTHLLPWQLVLSVCLLAAFLCPRAAAQSNPQVPQGGSNSFPATGTQATTSLPVEILNPAGAVVASFTSPSGSSNGWTVSTTAQVIGQIPMGPPIYGPPIYTVTAPASAAVGSGYRIRSINWMYPAGLAYFDVVAAPAPGVPSVPLNLGAFSGDAKVSLSWAGSLGATSYKVKRATTSGGPYTTVASPTGTTYTDSAVTNGTTYYYVVSAVNASGESANSNQASATPQMAPPYPPAPPAFSNVLETSVTVTAPALPINASSLTLQKKQASEPDTAYITVASGLAGGATTTVSGLTLGVTYTFRYLAIGGGGSTAGTAASVTTKPPAPAAPAAPVLSSVTSSGLSATLPALPANATSLSLQKRISNYAPYWETVATGQAAGAVVAVTGLSPNTSYDFQCVAVGTGGGTAGAVVQATTLPPAPGAPAFSNLTRDSVTVTAPAMPAPSGGPPSSSPPYTLTLQRKLTSEPDSSYVNVVTDLPVRDPAYSYYVPYRAVTEVTPLQSDVSHTFRYVAVGSGGVTNGAAATVTTSPQISWSAGGAIACGGIYWPQPGSNPTLALGARGRLSAFLATDWDSYQISADGVPSQTFTYSDPCSYSWSATGGSFENGVNTGQSVRWIAPTNVGTYTIRLTVDDQNAQNKPSADAGSRDDASRGYNDAPLTFQVSVTVQ